MWVLFISLNFDCATAEQPDSAVLPVPQYFPKAFPTCAGRAVGDLEHLS